MFNTCKYGVHKFRPRYSYEFNKDLIARLTNIKGDVDKLREKIYICDVCVKCGKKT